MADFSFQPESSFTTNTAYGVQKQGINVFPPAVIRSRAPSSSDTNFPLGQTWLDTSGSVYYAHVASGTWSALSAGSSDVDQLSGNSGVALPTGGNINILGGDNITSVGGSPTADDITINLDSTITLTSVNATTFDTNVAAAGVTLTGTTLSADGTDTNIDITITPKGTGNVVMSSVDINGGTIDDVVIGGSTAVAGSFTTVSASTSVTSPIYTTGAGVDTNINAATGQDLLIQMGDDAGSNKISFEDSASSEVASLDSDGNLITLGDTLTLVNTNTATTANIGNGTGGNTISLNNGANSSANTTNINAGASGANSTVNILSGNGTAGTQTLNVLTGNRAGALNLATGAAAHVISVGSGSAGAITVDTAAGISLDGATASNFTVTGAGEDLTLASVGGSVAISSTEDAASAISLTTNGGTSETLVLTNTQGTGNGAIALDATAGGISLDAALASNFTVTGAGEDLTLASAGGSVAISSTENAASAISLTSNGGTSETIVITNSQGTGAASINLASTAGGITLAGGLASTDAINLTAASGGVDIDGALEVNITSSEAAVADAVTISASAADGGITLDAGATPGVTFTNGTQSHQMLVGSGSPNGSVTASQGSLYVDVAGSTSTTILYVNTDGSTTWVGVGA